MLTLAIIILFILLVGGGAVAMLAKTVPIARRVYQQQLVRTSPDKWNRVCSAPENEEQMEMWNQGNAWADAHSQHIRKVQIENEGLKLFGEFFDQGAKRCAVILPGRCECLRYSYFYAKPYFDAGMNVLVIDTRAHGKSGGTHNTIGVAESRDLNAWIRYVCTEYNQEEIYLHGICIGTSSAMLAMTAEDAPRQIRGLVADGCFVSFRETFKRHMIADKRPLFPVLDLVMHQIRKHTGTNVMAVAPVKLVKKIDKRVLFLFGEQDIFSVPEMSRKLFDACASNDKQIVWFPKGGHSHIRLNNIDLYDSAVKEFIKHG